MGKGLAELPARRLDSRSLLRELPKRRVRLLRPLRNLDQDGGPSAAHALGGLPWGEDVFAQRCMDHHLVDKAEAFDVAMDGACAADRPKDQKKNKKWYPTDCSQLTTVTAHPLKKPAAFKRCLAEMS